MKPSKSQFKHYFAPGTVQHWRRPRPRLSRWLSLAAVLGLVVAAVALAELLDSAWSRL
jgi:hypothetical protein